MDAKHTPGPWDIITSLKHSIKITARANKIATVWWHPLAEDSNGGHPSMANAYLIAAAPLMLEALQVLVLTPHILNYLEAKDPMALEQANDAIAKAEGKSVAS